MDDRTLTFSEPDSNGGHHARVPGRLPAMLRTPGRALPLLLGGVLVLLTVAWLAERLYAHYLVWASGLFAESALVGRLALLVIGAALLTAGVRCGRGHRGWFTALRSRR